MARPVRKAAAIGVAIVKDAGIALFEAHHAVAARLVHAAAAFRVLVAGPGPDLVPCPVHPAAGPVPARFIPAAAPSVAIVPVLCHLHPPRAVSVDREIHLCPNPPRPAAVPAPDPSGVTDAAPGGSGQRRVPSGFTSTHSPRSAEM